MYYYHYVSNKINVTMHDCIRMSKGRRGGQDQSIWYNLMPQLRVLIIRSEETDQFGDVPHIIYKLTKDINTQLATS